MPVLPLILAGIFRLAPPLVGGPEGYILVARLLLALSSLVAVAAVPNGATRERDACADRGRSRRHLVLARLFRRLGPLIGANTTTVVLVVLSLASAPNERLTGRRLIAIGFCLGLGLMLRVHLGPGLFVIAVWVARRHLHIRWRPMAIGGLIPVVVFGMAD